MKVQVVRSVLKANDAVAAANRRRIEDAGAFVINLMSAPGSGKTTLLAATMQQLGMDNACGVIVGDLQTTRDATRLEPYAAATVQINTEQGCHLTPTQVAEALDGLSLDELSYLFIENVGNMVCPAAHDLGEHARVVLLSVPEGDDKVAKYPTLFQRADLILITKIDLLHVIEFDMDRVHDDLSRINTRAPVLKIASKTSIGMQPWLDWLYAQHRVRVSEASGVSS